MQQRREIPRVEFELSARIGRNVHQIRKRRKVTQTALCGRAALFGAEITVSVLSKIENGRKITTAFDLIVIAQCLSVPVSWLLEGDDKLDD